MDPFGITSNDFSFSTGEAMAVGEKSSIAAHDPVSSGEMAVCEAILNICSAPIWDLSKIALSANWMSSFDSEFDKYSLYQTAESITSNICNKLGVTIPVGKDSFFLGSRRHAHSLLVTSVRIRAYFVGYLGCIWRVFGGISGVFFVGILGGF